MFKACVNGDYYPDFTDCRKFYICTNNALASYTCASGTLYDSVNRFCATSSSAICAYSTRGSTTKVTQFTSRGTSNPNQLIRKSKCISLSSVL